MDKTKTITRRAAIVAALMSTIAMTVPVTASMSSEPPASPLPALIAAHKAAWRNLEKAGKDTSDAEEAVDVPSPGVQIGTNMTDRDHPEPQFASSIDQIEARAAMRMAVDEDLNRTRQSAFRVKKIAEFRLASRRYKAACRRCGFTAAEAAYHVAFDAECEARLALVVYRPADAAEAALKARYVRRAEAFTERWCEDEQFAALMVRRLGEVAL